MSRDVRVRVPLFAPTYEATMNISDFRSVEDFLLANPSLVEAAQTYHNECMLAGVKDPTALLLGLPLTIPQSAYFLALGRKEGYIAGQAVVKDALMKTLDDMNFAAAPK